MARSWELASQIFTGVFLALAAILALMGKARKLLRGPKALAAWVNGAGAGGCRRHRALPSRTSEPRRWKKPVLRRQMKVARRWKKPVAAGQRATGAPSRLTKVFAVPTPAPAPTGTPLGSTAPAVLERGL